MAVGAIFADEVSLLLGVSSSWVNRLMPTPFFVPFDFPVFSTFCAMKALYVMLAFAETIQETGCCHEVLALHIIGRNPPRARAVVEVDGTSIMNFFPHRIFENKPMDAVRQEPGSGALILDHQITGMARMCLFGWCRIPQ